MLSPIKRKLNKKGVSVVIGYILLISFAVVISTIVYQWLKSYVPSESLECPEGVSIFIKEYTYDCSGNTLSITLKNNGRFDLTGYYIRATTQQDQAVATLDLSDKILSGGSKSGNAITFGAGNLFPPTSPGNEKISTFNLAGLGTIYSLEIIPTRQQEVEGKNRFLSCANAKVKEELSCSSPDCIPVCGNRECGLDPNCGKTCLPDNCEVSGEVCQDSTGQCVAQEECTDTCASRGYECETWTICGVPKDCGLEIGCSDTELCNSATGQCELITYCGDGTVQDPNDGGVSEECDGTPFPEHCIAPDSVNECTCETGFVLDGTGRCEQDPTYNIGDYCRDLESGYSSGFCSNNAGQCTSYPGDLQAGGDYLCGTGQYGCCYPPQ